MGIYVEIMWRIEIYCIYLCEVHSKTNEHHTLNERPKVVVATEVCPEALNEAGSGFEGGRQQF